MAGNDSLTTDDPGAVAASAREHTGDATSDPPALAVGVGPGSSETLPERAVRAVADAMDSASDAESPPCHPSLPAVHR